MAVIELKNKTYKEIVEEYFRDRSTEIFPNSCMDHAHVIIQQIFTYATDYVYVFSHNLDSKLWDSEDIIDAVRGAIRRNVRIQFAVQEDHPCAKNLIEMLEDYGVAVSCNVHPNNKENFIVSDDRMLRYEERYEQVEALATANREDLASVLRSYFEEDIWSIGA